MAVFDDIIKKVRRFIKGISKNKSTPKARKKKVPAKKTVSKKKKVPAPKKKAVQKNKTVKKLPAKKVKKKTAVKKKKTVKRKVSPQKSAPNKNSGKSSKAGKPNPSTNSPLIGEITHFFSKIKVVVIKVTQNQIKVGDKINIKGTSTDIIQKVDSIQIESVDVKVGKKGQLVGLKVKKPAKVGDKVYKLS